MIAAVHPVFEALGCHTPAQQRNFIALLQRARLIDLPADTAALHFPPPPELRKISPAEILVDADTYQFRSNGDKAGVTNKWRFKGDHWDPEKHGKNPLLVHERLDGKIFVADGHHRLCFAKKLNAEGKEPKELNALVLREVDGYSVEDVKIIAAYMNIARGHSDAVDTARVIKAVDSGQVDVDLLPKLPLTQNIEQAMHLAKLSGAALDVVAKEEVPTEIAADIADKVTPEQQISVLRIVGARLKNYAQQLQSDREKLAESQLTR